MANEIIEAAQSKIAVIKHYDIGNIIKPLINEVHLLDSYIAGTMYTEEVSDLEALATGEELLLRREPDNRFDENAIMVLNSEGAKLGYIPEKDNVVFARLMDAGKIIKVSVIDSEYLRDYWKIRISLALVDL